MSIQNKKFTPTSEALSYVYPPWDSSVYFGYENLTDGKFGETTGRYSSKVDSNAIFEAKDEIFLILGHKNKTFFFFFILSNNLFFNN